MDGISSSGLEALKSDQCQNIMGDDFQLQSLLLDTSNDDLTAKHHNSVCDILLPDVNMNGEALGQNCTDLASIIPQEQLHNQITILQQPIQLQSLISNQTNGAVNISPQMFISEEPAPIDIVDDDAKTDFVANQVEFEQKSDQHFLLEMEKFQERLVEQNKFEKELLSTENLKSLIPYVVDLTSTYLRDFKEKDYATVLTEQSDKLELHKKLENDTEESEENVINQLPLPTTEVPIKMNEEEMKAFAKKFKQRRVSFGFTQSDVGLSLGNMLGSLFSQTTVCRFEAIQLSHNSMCKLYPLFSKWLEEVECNLNGTSSSLIGTSSRDQNLYYHHQHNHNQPPLSKKQRRKRTSLDVELKGTLEALFTNNQKPNGRQLDEIARQLNIEKDVARVWFCNRRQREKKHFTLMNEKMGGGILKQPLVFMQNHPPL